MIKLHILTLHWNNRERIVRLKNSLLPALNDVDFVWHIKDNGSTDNSAEEIINWQHNQINLIKYPHNKDSYSQGMNFLFNEAKPEDDDIIITLNNDIVFGDITSLKKLIKLLQEDNKIGLVGAKLNYINTNKIQHCGVLFHPARGLPFHFRGGQKEEQRDKVSRYYPAVTGAISLLKAGTYRNCFKNNSGNIGFNEKYNFGFEDIDLCMRIKYHLQKDIVYCGDVKIFHEESASLKKNPVQKMFFQPNAKTFMDNWHNKIDISLIDKYNDTTYAVYSNGKKQ